MKSQMSSFGELLPALAVRFRQNKEAARAFVFAAFRRAVGRQTLTNAIPVELKESVLIVAVSDNVWKRNLESLAPAILAKVSALVGFPLIRRIEFRVISERFPHSRSLGLAKSNKNRERKPAMCPAAIEQKALKISDHGLRRTFTAAAAACLSSRRQFSDKTESLWMSEKLQS